MKFVNDLVTGFALGLGAAFGFFVFDLVRSAL